MDLTTPAVRSHILEGDLARLSGGHRFGTGTPTKSGFPASWTDDRILHEISDVATDPASIGVRGPAPGINIFSGTRGGIDIKVWIGPDGNIQTGYPTNTPKNPWP